jgi:hypothetical protein
MYIFHSHRTNAIVDESNNEPAKSFFDVTNLCHEDLDIYLASAKKIDLIVVKSFMKQLLTLSSPSSALTPAKSDNIFMMILSTTRRCTINITNKQVKLLFKEYYFFDCWPKMVGNKRFYFSSGPDRN